MSLVEPLPAAALAGISVVALLLARRVRRLLADLGALSAQVDGLAARIAVAEQEVAEARLRTEAAETVLLEKGLADEDDLEAARRQSDGTPDELRRDDLH